MKLEKFIVYACPTGELFEQIEVYYHRSKTACGQNLAHQYMPHCSLTGFFEAPVDEMPIYLEALQQAYQQAKQQNIPLSIQILGMTFKPDWHGLELEGIGIQKIITDFIQKVEKSYVEVQLRPKNWLHLSLAYGFKLQHSQALKQLAQQSVNPQTPTAWELRFYQRHFNGQWTCHSNTLL
jgi:ubiquitin-associated SH3 domain-containing protein